MPNANMKKITSASGKAQQDAAMSSCIMEEMKMGKKPHDEAVAI